MDQSDDDSMSSHTSNSEECFKPGHFSHHPDKKPVLPVNPKKFISGEYLDTLIVDALSEELPKELLLGTKPSIKRDIFTAKIANKFEEVSGNVIQSFHQDLEAAYNKPLTPEQFQIELMQRLGLKNEA